ncbi:hypothetical protein HZF08_34525 [Paenibacillus sp. CGMCC 1.16610]|uniref:C1q domain-containing protein n=1 Tax=Paenibacillus anseongense TaxID=2682845 RepID=A0ABW9U370_9BACL|nr:MULTISPECIES: hypothetical protein [Paenibacillus]MBA2943389.1 hypothetical protein [Paenibacillus sp. CGMCC 1.16610]MVQ33886.1 hypothetical protein [Paenibacillus anseongense]
MPSTTTNLGFYKKNPSTDGNDTFDINTMLNDNWDKVDAQLGAQFADAAPTPVNLVNGLQVVDVPQTAPLENLRITGRTLVNLLGRDGNIGELGTWIGASGSSVTLDTTEYKYGSASAKATVVGANAQIRNNKGGGGYPIDNTKYYILVAEVIGNVPALAMSFENAVGGIGASTGTSVVPNSIFQTIYVTANPAQLSGVTAFYPAVVTPITPTNGQTFSADGFRMYQITQAEYTAIGSMTAAQIAMKYPYVDDAKHVSSPYVIKYGENLLPPFNEWTVNSTTIVVSPYVYSQPATIPSGAWLNVNIPVIPNKDYFLSFTTTGLTVAVFDSTASTAISAYSTNERTFNTGNNSSICVFVNGYGSGTVSNLMLNLGSTAKPFKPRNDDMLAFPNVQLASSVDGKVYDTLFKREGKYFVEKRFKDVVLDGSLPWIYGGGGTGWKYVSFGALSNSIPSSQRLVKYDGKIIGETAPLTAGDQSDLQSNGFFYISISSTDSGWGDSYTPTPQEIQAYFYGWKMSGNITDGTTPYTSGTKYWYVRNPNGTLGGWTPNLPTVRNSILPFYKLTYQLVTPTFEEIQIDGSISLHEGLNQIEVGQGIELREKMPLNSIDGIYFTVNDTRDTATYLKSPISKIINIFKNGKIESQSNRNLIAVDSTWTLNYSDVVTRGIVKPVLHKSAFDPTATYEVSYIVLDQYLLSTPVQAVTGQVASNLKTVVDVLCTNQADIEARVSANEIVARRTYDIQWQFGGVINPWGDNTYASRSRLAAINTVTQNISAGVATKVLYQNENLDNLSEYDTGLSRFTVKNSGTYLISGTLNFSPGMGAGVGCTIFVYANGAAYKTLRADNGSSNSAPMLNFVTQVNFATGSYVEVYVVTSSATVVATNTTLDITQIA